jgi:flagellar hook-basal body complex protein FliE
MIAALSLLDSTLGASSAAKISQTAETARATPAVSASDTDFGQILASASANAVGTLKSGEAASIAGIQGKASVQQVVESVLSAEQSLHTAIAIRDKIVAAYQALSQMAI